MPIPNFNDLKEGVIYDMPDADYRAAPGVSNSMLKHIALDADEPGSPKHFQAYFNSPQGDSDALFFGRQVHSRILTPDAPLEGIAAIPESYTNEKGEVKPWSGNAKVCKNWIDAQESNGIYPIKQSEIEKMNGVVNAIANNETCKTAFANGKPEVSLFKPFWRSNGMVLRKARLDWVSKGPALVDIKTCQDARAIEFESVIWKRRYYVQAAYYLDLWNDLNPNDQKTNFVIVAVEKHAPYEIQIFDLSQEDLAEGRREYQRNLSLLIHCINSDTWPGYPEGILPIKMRSPYNRRNTLND